MVTLKLIIVVILILFTSFFVATEFAIVKVRKSQIESLAEEGDKRAAAAEKVVNELDKYLSACQLGITMTALGIGWAGESAVSHLLEPLFEHIPFPVAAGATVAGVFSFIIITFLHVVFGELAPKSFSIQMPQKITLLAAGPLIWFNRIAFPFIWILNMTANGIAKIFGVSPMQSEESVHSEEELRSLLAESYQSGEINQSEYRYVDRIFEFDDRIAREIMIPRTEMVCLEKDLTAGDNLDIIQEHKFTRYPVIEEDKDHIIGLINIKELYYQNVSHEEPIQDYIRPVISVIETTPIKKLLMTMQKERVHMAVLLDEYGGTSGIVTVEDIIEEIVGEIRDEFDEKERPMIEKISEKEYIMDGKTLIYDVEQKFDIEIEHLEVDTIGGLILSRESEIAMGTAIKIDDVEFIVAESENNQIKKVRVLFS